jgi:hypothetical protein
MTPRLPILLILVAFACPLHSEPLEDDFLKCGDLRNFRAVSYLKVAEELQALPEAERVKTLERFCNIPERNLQAIILCRMLFTAKHGGTFRRPLLGGPGFITSTEDIPGLSDPRLSQPWPLEPITLADGVPFAIVTGYALAGAAEKAGAYLAYCRKETQWSSLRYHPFPREGMESALQKLENQIPSQFLTPWMKSFLHQQIENP